MSAPQGDPPAKPGESVVMIEAPPQTLWGTIRRIGPGLIVAGSIVGSGELIATTKTGAEAGFWLLWLILIGCVIKVFCQVEFGRYSLVGGKTTMFGLNNVPGPDSVISLNGGPDSSVVRGNWIVWFWFLMWFASIGQLGGIVGGVGQALAISIPLTDAGRQFNAFVDDKTQRQVKEGELALARADGGDSQRIATLGQEIEKLSGRIEETELNLVAAIRRENEEETANAGAGQLDLSAEIRTLTLIRTLGESEFSRLGGAGKKRKQIELFVKRLGAERFERLGGDPQRPNYWSFVAAVGRQRFVQLGGDLQNPDPDFVGAVEEFHNQGDKPKTPLDEFKFWATIIAVATSLILVMGRYGLIQSFSTVMVASFTLITVVNLVMLQSNPSWAVGWDDIVNGMTFRLPPPRAGMPSTGLATALATFGIIGVGASELITYPYWCLEKGYARFTGPHEATAEWAERARGWMRVMRFDAWSSMVVYTFATVAFYLLGAAVLGRTGLNPGGNDLIRTLAVMYEPVFGSTAQVLFLFGAFAVLYSTYFVANASHARVFSDALRVLGFIDKSEENRRRWIRFLSGFFPLFCLVFYIVIPAPAQLVLISGLMQAVMLPMLAAAALFFRYQRCDERIMPGRVWDIFLWVSAVGMLIAGVWAAWSKLGPIVFPG